MADNNSTPCRFRNIIMISLVEISVHSVGPIPFSCPLLWWETFSLPYAFPDLPKHVFIWCSASCKTLNIARAVPPATPKLIKTKIVIE